MGIFGRKSREPRRQVNADAWIVVNGSFGLRRCVVSDISPSGAKLKVSEPEKLPRQFDLSFTPGDRKGRRCEVAWRKATTVGVKFLKSDDKA